MDLEDEMPCTPEVAKQQGEMDAEEALRVCMRSLERSMKELNIPTPPFVKTSSAFLPLYRI